MYFTHRPARKADLETGFDHLVERAVYDEASRRDTLRFWTHLLECGSCITVVIEDRKQPQGKRQVVFGLSVFVTDRFVRQARTRLPPFLGLRLMEKWKDGERAFLNPEEIARANAGKGLNLVLLHYGFDDSRHAPEEVLRARQILQQMGILYHAGYKIKEVLNQYFGPELKKFIDNSGFTMRRDYQEFVGTPVLPTSLEAKIHPYLVGTTFAEASQKPGTRAALFCCQVVPPRFGFRPGQKEILEQAMKGETDESIAESLGISPWTIKKRWQAIYGKVLLKDPDLLTEDIPKGRKATASDPARRLKQRRRFLLEYLRHHPEEIRPGGPKSPN